MISLMSGGEYQNLFQLFTRDELLTVATFATMLLSIYMKAQIKETKDKKTERKFREIELNRMKRNSTDIKNVNTSKLFI